MMTSCGVDYIEISEPPTAGLSEELAAMYHFPPIPRKSWFKEFDTTLARTGKELGNTVAANGPLPQKETPSRIRAWGFLQVVASTQASAGRRGVSGDGVPPSGLCKEITTKKQPTFRDEHWIQRRSGLPELPNPEHKRKNCADVIDFTNKLIISAKSEIRQ
jgi:hypothetical protein